MNFDYKDFTDMSAVKISSWNDKYSGWIFSVHVPEIGLMIYQILGYKYPPFQPILQELNGNGVAMNDPAAVDPEWFNPEVTHHSFAWLKKEEFPLDV